MAFSTTIYLCSVPFTMNGIEQPWSETSEQQYSTFQRNWIKQTVTGIMTLHTGIVTLNGYIDTYREYNYLIFKNKDKLYYAFITDYEWASDNATRLHYEIDYFQTYQTDVTFNNCYILRKIVTDDTMFSNCLEEDIGVTKYTSLSKSVLYSSLTNYDIWVIDSRRLYQASVFDANAAQVIENYLGTPYIVPFTIFVAKNGEELSNIFEIYNTNSGYDFQKVVSIQLIPRISSERFATAIAWIYEKTFTGYKQLMGAATADYGKVRFLNGNNFTSPIFNTITIPRNDLIGLGLYSNVPQIKNNKCYTSQFMKLKYRVQGVDSYEIKPEDLTTATDSEGNIIIQTRTAFVNERVEYNMDDIKEMVLEVLNKIKKKK